MDDRTRWVAMLADAARQSSTQTEQICRLCVSMLGVSGAGISLVTRAGHRGVVFATNDVAAHVEELQFTLGEGPCVDSVRSGTPVLIADLQEPGDLTTEQWPTFLEGASAAGVRAVFAFPLLIGAISVGVLDMYRDEPGELSDEQLPAALLAADAAALALLRLEGERDDPFTDDAAMRSTYQLQVHQATGMVQVQMGMATEDAFLTLRARAFSSGQPLVKVATDVVERRVRFSTEDR